jgi:hypothetical protein
MPPATSGVSPLEKKTKTYRADHAEAELCIVDLGHWAGVLMKAGLLDAKVFGRQPGSAGLDSRDNMGPITGADGAVPDHWKLIEVIADAADELPGARRVPATTEDAFYTELRGVRDVLATAAAAADDFVRQQMSAPGAGRSRVIIDAASPPKKVVSGEGGESTRRSPRAATKKLSTEDYDLLLETAGELSGGGALTPFEAPLKDLVDMAWRAAAAPAPSIVDIDLAPIGTVAHGRAFLERSSRGGGAYKHYASLPASTDGPSRALLILEAKTFITAVHIAWLFLENDRRFRHIVFGPGDTEIEHGGATERCAASMATCRKLCAEYEAACLLSPQPGGKIGLSPYQCSVLVRRLVSEINLCIPTAEATVRFNTLERAIALARERRGTDFMKIPDDVKAGAGASVYSAPGAPAPPPAKRRPAKVRSSRKRAVSSSRSRSRSRSRTRSRGRASDGSDESESDDSDASEGDASDSSSSSYESKRKKKGKAKRPAASSKKKAGGSGGSKSRRATAEQQAAWAPEGWCFDYMLGGCGRHTGKCKEKSQFTHPTSAEQKTHGKKKKKKN